jgi:hypothetical protein
MDEQGIQAQAQELNNERLLWAERRLSAEGARAGLQTEPRGPGLETGLNLHS